MNFRSVAAALLLGLHLLPHQAYAWGATGHEFVSGVGAEALPEEIPAFLRTPAVAAEIAVLGRELDRSKGAGRIHDHERDAGHFVNLADDGTVNGVALDPLPPTREAYDTELRRTGTTQYRHGYLPYSIVDGWQQLVKDFAYWRAGSVAERNAVTAEDRAWFAQDRRLRERLIVRDLGVWSHYVGDAAQPLHVSVHFDTWGPFPNLNGYTQTRGLHARMEGAFLRDNVERAAVARAVAPYRGCPFAEGGVCGIEERMRMLILESHANVVQVFELEKRGAFQDGNKEGAAFVTAQLARGSSALRDMVVDAWRASANTKISWPEIEVRDVVSGKRVLVRKDFGDD